MTSPDPFSNIPPDVLTNAQLAERLGFTDVTVRNWTTNGTIPGRLLGREWRYWWPQVVIALFYNGEDADDDKPTSGGPTGTNGAGTNGTAAPG
jgi:hypothetical protein